MAFNTIFANLTAGNQPASLLDTNYNQAGNMGFYRCNSSGTNAITLTPISSGQPAVSAYANYLQFGFIAPATPTSTVTIAVSGLASLNAYTSDGDQLAANGLLSGQYYEVVYIATLNSGAGGFQLVSPYGPIWTAYTPVISSGSGSFTSVSATGSYKKVGKIIFFQITINVTTAGTAGGYVSATLPTTVGSANFVVSGRETSITGYMLNGFIASGGNTAIITKYDNTFLGASGDTLNVSGFYESI